MYITNNNNYNSFQEIFFRRPDFNSGFRPVYFLNVLKTTKSVIHLYTQHPCLCSGKEKVSLLLVHPSSSMTLMFFDEFIETFVFIC
jgi:hypothetical protein